MWPFTKNNPAQELEKPVVIVTGCGFKPVAHVYTYNGKPTHNEIEIDGVAQKMNIGTAASYVISKKGVEVIMVSRTKENLEKIKEGLVKLGCAENLLSYVAADITTDEGVDVLVKSLPKDRVIYWVQSIGMGGGTYKIPNDNIYLPFEQISPDLIAAEMSITSATHRLMLKMMPIFRKQIANHQKAKICVVTSMSGERGYHYGATHVAAKHSLVGYIKGVEKELEDEGVQIFDVRPGGIDTGMYDNPHTKASVEDISRKTKMWEGRKPVYGEPLKVGEAIYNALFNPVAPKVQRILAPHQK